MGIRLWQAWFWALERLLWTASGSRTVWAFTATADQLYSTGRYRGWGSGSGGDGFGLEVVGLVTIPGSYIEAL